MPTSAAIARAAALVVAGEQHRRQPERAQVGDRLGGRRLDRSATTNSPATAPSIAAATTVRPWLSSSASAASSSRRELEAPLGEHRRPADDDRVPVDDGLDAEAAAVREALDRRERPALGAGERRDRLRDRVLARVLGRAGEPQQLRAVDAVGGDALRRPTSSLP